LFEFQLEWFFFMVEFNQTVLLETIGQLFEFCLKDIHLIAQFVLLS
jgi:hypothetical protein